MSAQFLSRFAAAARTLSPAMALRSPAFVFSASAFVVGMGEAVSATPAASAAFPAPPDTALLAPLRAEIRRSLDSLSVAGRPEPYFLSAMMWDIQSWTATASEGVRESHGSERMRLLDVDVRVGNYDLDQSLFQGAMVFGPGLRAPVPETPEPLLLRQALWALIDARYKVGLETLAQKKAFLAGRHLRERLPDWTRGSGKPGTRIDLDSIRPPDTAAVLRALTAASLASEASPAALESRLGFQYYYTTFYYVDSEGHAYVQSLQEHTLVGAALVQSIDGSPEWDYFRQSARQGLPRLGPASEGPGWTTAWSDSLGRITQRLNALARLPAATSYRGPILFDGAAAGEIVHRALLQPQTQLREPLGEGTEAPHLLSLEGRRLFPRFLTIRDQPDGPQLPWGKPYGAYRFDHQGEPGKPVQLVEKGKVVDFYAGKTPFRSGQTAGSNGHHRYGGGFPGIVTVESERALPPDSLRLALAAWANEEGIPMGLRVRRFLDEDAFKLLRHPLASRLPLSSGTASEGGFVLPAVVAADLYDPESDRWLPVRGLHCAPIDTKSLRSLVATGDRQAILEPQGSFTLLCPSLLFSLLDMAAYGREHPRPPYLPSSGPP